MNSQSTSNTEMSQNTNVDTFFNNKDTNVDTFFNTKKTSLETSDDYWNFFSGGENVNNLRRTTFDIFVKNFTKDFDHHPYLTKENLLTQAEAVFKSSFPLMETIFGVYLLRKHIIVSSEAQDSDSDSDSDSDFYLNDIGRIFLDIDNNKVVLSETY